ncbi:hypothetical protein BSP21_053 [Bacillus phage BSP21]|nr:hypothetical protein BSP21_053 [Bacillus phage BSP21]AYJ75789.1 hypothetical protein BSP18_155 [Bacillus phage BSP18]
MPPQDKNGKYITDCNIVYYFKTVDERIVSKEHQSFEDMQVISKARMRDEPKKPKFRSLAQVMIRKRK